MVAMAPCPEGVEIAAIVSFMSGKPHLKKVLKINNYLTITEFNNSNLCANTNSII
jgi:hypothetical protein